MIGRLGGSGGTKTMKGFKLGVEKKSSREQIGQKLIFCMCAFDMAGASTCALQEPTFQN